MGILLKALFSCTLYINNFIYSHHSAFCLSLSPCGDALGCLTCRPGARSDQLYLPDSVSSQPGLICLQLREAKPLCLPLIHSTCKRVHVNMCTGLCLCVRARERMPGENSRELGQNTHTHTHRESRGEIWLSVCVYVWGTGDTKLEMQNAC